MGDHTDIGKLGEFEQLSPYAHDRRSMLNDIAEASLPPTRADLDSLRADVARLRRDFEARDSIICHGNRALRAYARLRRGA